MPPGSSKGPQRPYQLSMTAAMYSWARLPSSRSSEIQSGEPIPHTVPAVASARASSSAWSSGRAPGDLVGVELLAGQTDVAALDVGAVGQDDREGGHGTPDNVTHDAVGPVADLRWLARRVKSPGDCSDLTYDRRTAHRAASPACQGAGKAVRKLAAWVWSPRTCSASSVVRPRMNASSSEDVPAMVAST